MMKREEYSPWSALKWKRNGVPVGIAGSLLEISGFPSQKWLTRWILRKKVAWGSREVIFITKPLEKPLCHVSPPEVNETFQLPMTYARTQLLMMSFWNLNPSSSRTSTPEFNTCDVIRVSEMKGVFSTSTFDLPHHILKIQICRSTFRYHILVVGICQTTFGNPDVPLSATVSTQGLSIVSTRNFAFKRR